jgi:hypothetical protein
VEQCNRACQTRGRIVWQLTIFCLSFSLAACNATVYKDEVTSLAAAGKVLTGTIPNYSQSDQSAISTDVVNTLIIRGVNLDYNLDCKLKADTALRALRFQVGLAPDNALSSFRDNIKPCDLTVLPITTSMEVQMQPGAGNRRNSDAPISTIEQRLTAACRAISIPPAAGRSMDATRPSTELLFGSLNTYLTTLPEIVNGESVTKLQKAEKASQDSVASLAKATSLPAYVTPASGIIFSFLGIGLEQARFNVLKNAVISFECVWLGAVPDVKNALRELHARYIAERANVASLAAELARNTLNDPSVIHQPGIRLILFQQLESDVRTKNDQMMAAVNSDPGKAIDAFTKAHHELALSVFDTKRELKPMLDSLSALGDSVVALDKALNPTPVASGKK